MLLAWFIEIFGAWGLMFITTSFTKDLDAATTLVLGHSWLVLDTFGPLHLRFGLWWWCVLAHPLELIVSFFAVVVRILPGAGSIWVMDWWFNDHQFYSRCRCQTFRVLSFRWLDDSFVFWVLQALQFFELFGGHSVGLRHMTGSVLLQECWIERAEHSCSALMLLLYCND